MNVVSIVSEFVAILRKIKTFEQFFLSSGQEYLLIINRVLDFGSILFLLLLLLDLLNDAVRFEIEKIDMIFIVWCMYLLGSLNWLGSMSNWRGGLLHLLFCFCCYL